jgi:hypothetical protein
MALIRELMLDQAKEPAGPALDQFLVGLAAALLRGQVLAQATPEPTAELGPGRTKVRIREALDNQQP